MPLASLVQVPFIWLFGSSPVASALPFALIGSLAAPLTWAIGRDAGLRPLVSVGAGVLTAIPALSLVYMTQPDNFSLYQPLVAGALWMAARGLRGHARSFALGGLLVGLATLSRNDGLLVGATLGLAFLYDRWRAWRSGGARRPAIPVWAAVACFGLFLVVMAPWWIRQLEVFGQLSPSTASGKVLYIRSIEEWNSITTPATLGHLLGQGAGPLLLSRVGGFVAAVGIFTTLVGGRDPAAVHAHRRVGAAAVGRLRAVLDVRRDPLRVLGAGLGGPRAGRDLHPLGGRPGAPRLPARARGHRRCRRLDRGATAGLGPRHGDEALRHARRSGSRSSRRFRPPSSSRDDGIANGSSDGRSPRPSTWPARRPMPG